MISILLADDHQLFADSLRLGIDRIPDLRVLQSVHDGKQLLAALEEQTPDVILTDLEMPGLDGFDVLRQAAGTAPVIVVTMHSSREHRDTAISLQAAGFLPKSTPLPDLAAAIRAVAMGEILLEETTQREILDRHLEPVLDPGAASLTARERELLKKLSEGVTSTHDLADELFISEKTVKNHLASIYDKLAVSDRAQAAIEAIRLGIAAQ